MAPHFDEQLLKETGDAAGDAELGSISIGDLIKGDEKTRADLFTACRHLGFFYLDCRDHLRPTLQLKSRRSLPLHSNFMIFRMPKRINGLASCTREIQNSNRAAGDRTGCVEGKKDGWEEVLFFEHPLSQFPKDQELPAPEAFRKNRELIEHVNKNLSDMSRLILDSLSKSLLLNSSESLVQNHKADEPSGSSLEILKYLPYVPGSEKVGHVPHTDMGSLSMVFSEVGGLQVYHPEKNGWTFIEPKPGHAVCNIGDSLSFLSGKVLRSSLHRVVPYPQAQKLKMSVIYFLRPDNNAEFTGADGKRWKLIDWINMKGSFFVDGLEEEAPRSVLTGCEGHDEFWDETHAS